MLRIMAFFSALMALAMLACLGFLLITGLVFALVFLAALFG